MLLSILSSEAVAVSPLLPSLMPTPLKLHLAPWATKISSRCLGVRLNSRLRRVALVFTRLW